MNKLLLIIVIVTFLAGCAPSNDVVPSVTPAASTSVEKPRASGASAQGYVAPIHHADLAYRTGGRVAQVLV